MELHFVCSVKGMRAESEQAFCRRSFHELSDKVIRSTMEALMNPVQQMLLHLIEPQPRRQ